MELRTERLVIRPWRLDEAPVVLDILSRVEVVRWLDDGEPVLMKDLDEARARIEGWRELAPPRGQWAIEVAETGLPVGSVMLVPIPHSQTSEGGPLTQVGWHLHPDAQGHGYASEAARAVVRHGLAGGLPELRALMYLDNEPSIAVAERIGMRDQGITDDWYETPSRVFLVTAADVEEEAV